MRPRACNFLLALLQMEDTCWSKLSSESIKIPSKASFVPVLNEASPILRSVNIFENIFEISENIFIKTNERNFPTKKYNILSLNTK